MTEPIRAVFLSYASQDAEEARCICDALRAAGIEVWFDQSELRGGDAWDRQIRKQIHDCALFIPIISAHTQARLEGYFRREWKLAADRTHDMAEERAFLVPVVIDDTSERYASVPEKFHEVQWTRLPAGETPSAFVERVSRLLSPEPAHASAEVRATTAAAPHTAAVPGQPAPGPPASHQTQRVLLLTVAVMATIGVGYVADKLVLSKRVAAGTQTSTAGAPAQSAIPEKSIAVLPFVNMSSDKEQEYFSDGLSEELINMLTKVPDLRVPARTSSFYFKGKSEDIATIAQRLHVANVLEGSVRKSGNTLRVTAQLIRADNGYHLWSETYDRELKDVFRVQDEIAGAVVSALKLQLAPLRDAARQRPNVVPEAYEQFLLGRDLLNRGSEESQIRSRAAFLDAARLDPGFAAAYAYLALAEIAIADQTDDDAGYDRARMAAEKALALAPQLGDAFHARGLYRLFTLDITGAYADFQRAVALAPADGQILASYGRMLNDLGRSSEAVEVAKRAIVVDPLNAAAWGNLGKFLVAQGDFRGARKAFDRALAIGSENVVALFGLAMVNLLEGQLEAARLGFARQTAVNRILGAALTEHSLGQAAASQRALDELIAGYSLNAACQVADAYAWRGERDKAFVWLDRAYRQRDSGLTELKVDPFLASLRGDARYTALLRKINFPD